MGTHLLPISIETKIQLDAIKGSAVALDASNLLFQLIYNPQQKKMDELYTDGTHRIISHLYGLIYKMTNFYKQGILPVVVFDGKADELKRNVTRDEGADFRMLELWYRKAIKDNDKETAKSIAYNRLFLWKNAVKEAKQLLISMGIPIVTAPGEAEAQCASLVARNFVDYAISNDYDTLLFGCPKLLRNLTFSGRTMIEGKWRSEKASAKRMYLNEILRKNKIDLVQLVDISLLIGNDFFSGIDGIGPIHALELVQKYGDIFGALGHLKKYDSVDRKRLGKARDLLLFPVVLDKIPELEWRFPNAGGIYSLMCNDHCLNREKTEKGIESLIKSYKKVRKGSPKYVDDTKPFF